jgi:hypothetical protein
VSPTEYWVCLKYFGTKVEQAKKIDSLEKKLNSVHQVVCQLISGLYNKETQNCAYRLERDILDGGYGMMDYSISALDNTSKWDFSPTTRQGDDCERRIENLEQIVQNLMETFQDK